MTTATASPAATPGLSIRDGSVYRGRVTDQRLTLGYNDVPQLELTIPIEGELVNARKPEAGVVAAPQVTAEVVMKLDANDITKMEYTIGDLQRLGFTGEDPEALAPGHKNHHSFVGQTVYVAPKRKVYNDKESLFWNLRFPRTFTNAKVEKGDLKKSGAADAYKEALRSLNEKRAQKQGDGI